VGDEFFHYSFAGWENPALGLRGFFPAYPPATPMKTKFWLYPACLISLFLSSCANRDNEGNPLETGPFDSAGNYREDWVADPSKWNRPGSKPGSSSDEIPLVSNNDVPPPDANPLAPAVSQPKPTQTTSTRSKVQSNIKPTNRATASTRTGTKPKPKQPVVKAKPKPKNRTYVIQNGDSLDKIARKTGSSVKAIQQANGIKGTLIHPGKVLVVPPAKR
jgi:LysM repeat protein